MSSMTTASSEQPKFTSDPVQKVIKVSGDRILASADPGEGERFLAEIQYLNFYLKEIGTVLGTRGIRMGVLEEDGAQIAFRNYTSVHTEEVETHGVFIGRALPFRVVLNRMP